MSTVSSAFLNAFSRRALGQSWLRFDAFMDLALYDPEVGYYTASRQRVGFAPQADFFTATSSGPLFGELVVAAVTTLLAGHDLRQFTWVEVGAEPSLHAPEVAAGILRDVAHPFGATRTVRLGQPVSLAGPVVLFSNELFDAQPCRRFVLRAGRWQECAVQLRDHLLQEIEIPVTEIPPELPTTAPEGYRLDLSFASRSLLRQLAAPGWHGLILAFDYGKSWAELVTATPQGTARAYHRHQQSNDLLAQPGEQDLTAHVCWDWLCEDLRTLGFTAPAVLSQEAFFIHNAGPAIAQTMAAEANRLSQRKLALLQLLHPSHLGQKFQVLHALRPGP